MLHVMRSPGRELSLETGALCGCVAPIYCSKRRRIATLPPRALSVLYQMHQWPSTRSTKYTQIYTVSGLFYYLRSVKDCQWLAYPPRLAVDLGSYVDGEAHGWAR